MFYKKQTTSITDKLKTKNNPQMRTKVKSQWKPLTSKEEKQIFWAYNSGELKKEILLKYQIPIGQFYSVVRNYLPENEQ